MVPLLVIERLVWIAGAAIVTASWVGRNSWTWPLLQRLAERAQRLSPGYQNRQLLQKIAKQLYPNSGTSLVDAVNRIEVNQTVIYRELRVIARRQMLFDEALGIATFVADQHGDCINASSSYLELSGLTIEEVRRDGWRNVVSNDERDRISREWDAVVREGRDLHIETVYQNIRTREQIPVQVDAYAVEFNGVIAGWVGHVTPLTQKPRRPSHPTR